jgi:protein-tyrosine phosphatase
LPDGTIVRPRPVRERDPDDSWRDFGLYCDPRWEPSWPSDLIDWPDFGVPSDSTRAAGQIIAAFERARSGQHLEVGCIGGLGRTGTVLACMAVLAGIPPADSIVWVRETYNRNAIETPEQERWVEWFAGFTTCNEEDG